MSLQQVLVVRSITAEVAGVHNVLVRVLVHMMMPSRTLCRKMAGAKNTWIFHSKVFAFIMYPQLVLGGRSIVTLFTFEPSSNMFYFNMNS